VANAGSKFGRLGRNNTSDFGTRPEPRNDACQTRNEISVGIVDLLSQVATDTQLAGLIRRADSGEVLTADEYVQYEHRSAAMFRYFENVHYQYRLGLYDETEFSKHKESWRSYFAVGKMRVALWCQYREITSAEFMAEIDSLLPTNSC
jgi:hypothetical protein